MGVRIFLADKEPIEVALKRFKKLLEHHGAAWELRRRRHFVKPTEARRTKRFKKIFNARLTTLMAKRVGEQPTSSDPEDTKVFWKNTGKS